MTDPHPLAGFDHSGAVQYHYGKFPPHIPDMSRLLKPVSQASAALARYDQMLKSMHNSDFFLAPLRYQEAVVSSRMEGTVSTLDEVLRVEAEQEEEDDFASRTTRSEAIEVLLYSRAMKWAQARIQNGQPISPWLIRSSHETLLGFGRGAQLSPGEFKTEQNYLVDKIRKKILFVPIRPTVLNDGLEILFEFIEKNDLEILVKTALVHLEFEALHPFKDGNGRIGRMIIPLLLWKAGAISQPNFYISAYFEKHKDEYIDRMRAVSDSGAWLEWITFFLAALEAQANQNLQKAEEIKNLYQEMKQIFIDISSSKWAINALDFVFTRPVFKNSQFTTTAQIPAANAHKITRKLAEAGILRTLHPAAGRRPAVFAFEPLLALVRS